MRPVSELELWLLRGNAIAIAVLWGIANVPGWETVMHVEWYANFLVYVLCAGPCIVIAMSLLRLVTWLLITRDEHGRG